MVVNIKNNIDSNNRINFISIKSIYYSNYYKDLISYINFNKSNPISKDNFSKDLSDLLKIRNIIYRQELFYNYIKNHINEAKDILSKVDSNFEHFYRNIKIINSISTNTNCFYDLNIKCFFNYNSTLDRLEFIWSNNISLLFKDQSYNNEYYTALKSTIKDINSFNILSNKKLYIFENMPLIHIIYYLLYNIDNFNEEEPYINGYFNS